MLNRVYCTCKKYTSLFANRIFFISVCDINHCDDSGARSFSGFLGQCQSQGKFHTDRPGDNGM